MRRTWVGVAMALAVIFASAGNIMAQDSTQPERKPAMAPAVVVEKVIEKTVEKVATKILDKSTEGTKYETKNQLSDPNNDPTWNLQREQSSQGQPHTSGQQQKENKNEATVKDPSVSTEQNPKKR